MRDPAKLRRGDLARARLDQRLEQVVHGTRNDRSPRYDGINEIRIKRICRPAEGAERDRVVAFTSLQADNAGWRDVESCGELTNGHVEGFSERRDPPVSRPNRTGSPRVSGEGCRELAPGKALKSGVQWTDLIDGSCNDALYSNSNISFVTL